ncbi:uncharacterized protein LOC110347519, partial [Heterocephalus glaber]|uniref:Uncharacterized protein LOC110347519 n=1 Tax=Heterocephalus glaber TaxID=10181 RepID=A0AAX6SGU9_HETGA
HNKARLSLLKSIAGSEYSGINFSAVWPLSLPQAGGADHTVEPRGCRRAQPAGVLGSSCGGRRLLHSAPSSGSRLRGAACESPRSREPKERGGAGARGWRRAEGRSSTARRPRKEEEGRLRVGKRRKRRPGKGRVAKPGGGEERRGGARARWKAPGAGGDRGAAGRWGSLRRRRCARPALRTASASRASCPRRPAPGRASEPASGPLAPLARSHGAAAPGVQRLLPGQPVVPGEDPCARSGARED